MSLYAASNISTAVKQFKNRGYAALKGIILNAKGIKDEQALVEKVAEELETDIVHYVPRDPVVQEAENMGQTVIEAFPDSDMAKQYFDLAKKMMA